MELRKDGRWVDSKAYSMVEKKVDLKDLKTIVL
jgi:hypothetical protein